MKANADSRKHLPWIWRQQHTFLAYVRPDEAGVSEAAQVRVSNREGLKP